jgi:hypothetical protein
MNPAALRAVFSPESDSDLITLVTFYDPDPAPVTATEMIAGNTYKIKTVGSTNFTSYGSATNTVGTVFVASSAGVGTGTVVQQDKVLARLSDGFTQRLTTSLEAGDIVTTDSEVVYGVVSNLGVVGQNKNYTFLPMQITLPNEDEAQAPRCSLVLNDVTRYLTPVIRNLTSPPKIKLNLVLNTDTNTSQVEFVSFYISSITYNRDSVTCDLSMINFEREPFPMHSFNPSNFPGLF